MDNSGTREADGERFPAGMHEQTTPEPVSSPRTRHRLRRRPLTQLQALRAQVFNRNAVRRRQCAHNNIHDGQDREHVDPYDFAEPSFHEVAIHGGTPVARHNDADPWGTQKGSDPPNLELRGSDSLPFFAYRLELFLPRQPRRGRKAMSLRRRRTSTAASR